MKICCIDPRLKTEFRVSQIIFSSFWGAFPELAELPRRVASSAACGGLPTTKEWPGYNIPYSGHAAGRTV